VHLHMVNKPAKETERFGQHCCRVVELSMLTQVASVGCPTPSSCLPWYKRHPCSIFTCTANRCCLSDGPFQLHLPVQAAHHTRMTQQVMRATCLCQQPPHLHPASCRQLLPPAPPVPASSQGHCPRPHGCCCCRPWCLLLRQCHWNHWKLPTEQRHPAYPATVGKQMKGGSVQHWGTRASRWFTWGT
jgi:hypothetical protein